MTCEHDNLILTEEDTMRSKYWIGAGATFIVGWVTFLLYSLDIIIL